MILFDKIKNFQNELGGTFLRARQNALDELKRVGLPHRRVESWKYTNITEKLDKNFSLLEASEFSPQFAFECELIRISNGKILDQKDFLEVKELDLDAFTKEVDDSDPLYLYNIATGVIGHELTFKSAPNHPVVFYHLNDEKTSHGSLATQFKIKVNPHLKIDLLEVFESKANNVTSLVQAIDVASNAQLFHTVLAIGSEENTSHLYTKANVAKDSVYQNIKILLKNALIRNEVKLLLNEEGAHAEAHGLYALNYNEHSDTNSLIHHKAAHTTSAQLYKGVMANESKGIFTGLVKVEKGAQLIDSNQLNKNLLLSKKTHAFSRPQLEIFADDVKCSHGSTTGQISPEELFYLETRGIKPMRARRLLSQAFAFDVILKIKNQKIKKYIEDIFTESYQGLEEINND